MQLIKIIKRVVLEIIIKGVVQETIIKEVVQGIIIKGILELLKGILENVVNIARQEQDGGSAHHVVDCVPLCWLPP